MQCIKFLSYNNLQYLGVGTMMKRLLAIARLFCAFYSGFLGPFTGCVVAPFAPHERFFT